MPSKDKNYIYKILGVDPSKKSTASSNAYIHQFKSRDRSKEIVDDPSAPSGSVFENYSKYPREEYLYYWRQYRILWIVGIITFFSPVILYYIDRITADTHYRSKSSYEYEEEYEDDEVDYTMPHISQVEEPAEVKMTLPESLTLSGSIDNTYGVKMKIDTQNRTGEYYYTRNGDTANNMRLEITDIDEVPDGYRIIMNEYDPHYEYCGTWDGIYNPENETYKGMGEYHGNSMPFDTRVSTTF